MRLGSETVSLVNHLQSRQVIGEPVPVVGMGATLLSWMDRNPATIKSWDGKILTLTEDDALRIDSNGMSESQEYEYTTRPDSRPIYFRKDRKGLWRQSVQNENGRWVFSDGQGLRIGKREKYHDFSF